MYIELRSLMDQTVNFAARTVDNYVTPVIYMQII